MNRVKVLLWSLMLAATLVGAALLFDQYTGGAREFLANVAKVDAGHWAGIATLTAAFYALDWFRLYALLSLFGIRVSLGLGLRLTCVSYLVSSLIPMAELSAPMIIFVLVMEGIPVGVATAVALAKSTYLLFWICVSAAITLQLGTGVNLPQVVSANIVYVGVLVALAVAPLVLVVLFPRPLLAWVERRLATGTPSGFFRKVLVGLDHSARSIAEIGKSTRPMHLLTHAGSIAMVLVYVAIGHLLADAIAPGMPWLKSLAVFSNSYMIAYLAPIPGSIGVTEALTSYLMDPAMTEPNMAVATVLRILCWYGTWLPGSILVLGMAHRFGWKRLFKGKPVESSA